VPPQLISDRLISFQNGNTTSCNWMTLCQKRCRLFSYRSAESGMAVRKNWPSRAFRNMSAELQRTCPSCDSGREQGLTQQGRSHGPVIAQRRMTAGKVESAKKLLSAERTAPRNVAGNLAVSVPTRPA
jgi:hypothetical protein